ncbi:uncharacterized protein EI97DRAFT_360785, partial [Westerdykella ornata]
PTPVSSTYGESPLDATESSIPTAGSTYIIVSATSGHAITFRGGVIILERIGGPGNIRWECVETNGWLGFRDPASALYFGRCNQSTVHCKAPHHKGWEFYCVRHTSRNGGGYVLL